MVIIGLVYAQKWSVPGRIHGWRGRKPRRRAL